MAAEAGSAPGRSAAVGFSVNGGYEYRERLGREANGSTVLAWLAGRHRHSTEPVWRARIDAGEVSLDGVPASAGGALRTGQCLAWRRPPWAEPVVPLGFAILFRDDALLAVAKPRGLPSVPNGGFLEHTLLHQLRRLHPEAVPMHRLGRGTSGLLLFARTEAARRAVATEWRAGRVEKEYRALVSGVPRQKHFTIDAPIGLVRAPTARARVRRGERRQARPLARGVARGARGSGPGGGSHPDGAPAPDPHSPGGGRTPAAGGSALRHGRRAGAAARPAGRRRLPPPRAPARARPPCRPARGSSSSAPRRPSCARRDSRDERVLLRPRELLEAVLFAQRRPPGPHAARPHEPHRQPRAGVTRGPSRLVPADARGQVLRGSGVERAVPAAQDVDERQAASP